MQTFRNLAEKLSCAIDHVVTDGDLRELTTYLNSVLKQFKANVRFTSHFLDRVNDARNDKQITVCELARIFLEAFKQHRQDFMHVKKDQWEAVLADNKTSVNVPFVLKHNGENLELVAKTVMRKANFHTPDKKYTVAHFEPKGSVMTEQKAKTFRDLMEWVGFNTAEVAPMATVQSVDSVDNGAMYVEDPMNLDMLNAYCHQINTQQFVNPYFPLNALWSKLNLIGLNFDSRSITFVGDHGVQEAPLTQYGGRYGFVGPEDTFGQDDGISHRLPGGLKIVIRFTKQSGIYTLDAQIVGGESAPADTVTEAISRPTNEAGWIAHYMKQSKSEVLKAGHSVEQALRTLMAKPELKQNSDRRNELKMRLDALHKVASQKVRLSMGESTVSEAQMKKPVEGPTFHMTGPERTVHGLKHSQDKIDYWNHIIQNHRAKGTDATRAIKFLKRAQDSLKIFKFHHASENGHIPAGTSMNDWQKKN